MAGDVPFPEESLASGEKEETKHGEKSLSLEQEKMEDSEKVFYGQSFQVYNLVYFSRFLFSILRTVQ